jgi:RNA polymerase sigma-70 factor (ECF subfamily)
LEPPDFPTIPLKRSPDGEYGVSVMETHATALMTATKGGDANAFDSLVTLIRGRAFHVARGFVGSHEDARELCQEAFMKTWRARETFRDGEPFLPWFHRILRNTCFSFLRKNKRLKKHSLSGGPDSDDNDWDIGDDSGPVSAGLERDDAARAFWCSFRELSARDREILTLRHFQELPYREIARVLEIPEGTVMSRLFHARRRLRDALSPHLTGALSDFAPDVTREKKEAEG